MRFAVLLPGIILIVIGIGLAAFGLTHSNAANSLTYTTGAANYKRVYPFYWDITGAIIILGMAILFAGIRAGRTRV
jgi:hypothetical protein